MQFLRVHGKSTPSELRYTYCFNVLSTKTDRRARHRRTHLISPRALMTTTTRLYKPDQMTLGKFEGQITQARVVEDGRQSELHMCALVAVTGTTSFGFSKICYYNMIRIFDTLAQRFPTCAPRSPKGSTCTSQGLRGRSRKIK